MMLVMPQSKLMLVVCFCFLSVSSLLTFFCSSSFTSSPLLLVVNSPHMGLHSGCGTGNQRQAPFIMILGQSFAAFAST